MNRGNEKKAKILLPLARRKRVPYRDRASWIVIAKQAYNKSERGSVSYKDVSPVAGVLFRLGNLAARFLFAPYA